MDYNGMAAKRRKKPSAAKPQPKGIEPRISRISRMKTQHTAFCIAIIPAIRGKNLRETGRLWLIAVQKAFCLCAFCAFSRLFSSPNLSSMQRTTQYVSDLDISAVLFEKQPAWFLRES